ncbi:MAG TPA: hypothetical protein PLH32_18235 [bacterium]|nr:hypothetical protein [bacterium]
MTKRCSKCGIEYPATTEFFYRRRDGLYPHCKRCQNKLTAQWRVEHPAERKVIKKRCDQNHRNLRSAYTQKWRKEHPEEAKAMRHNYYKAHRNEIADSQKIWQQNNREWKNQYQRTWRTLQKAKRLCTKCSNPIMKNHTQFCEAHWYKKVAQRNTGSTKNWEFLKKLAAKQNFTCPYSGEHLIPGINMSLDHKYPVSRFPDYVNNLENLQWVSIKINQVKRDLTHDEFIVLVKQIWDRWKNRQIDIDFLLAGIKIKD